MEDATFDCVVEAQSSFKLQRFLCSKGYAMDNLDWEWRRGGGGGQLNQP